jgi:NIMA (never in mitosis gene a)-related kinase
MNRPVTATELQQFDILRKLGEGSYSSVFKVLRKSDSQEYAMKRIKMQGLSNKERDNAVNEVRILASIISPYVVQYREALFDEATHNLHIVMEYMPGGDML